MTGPYVYTPAIWPMLASAVFVATLAVIGWRRRHTPGAKPFVVLMGCFSAWALFSALGVAAVAGADKIFWFKAEVICAITVAVPSLCFALEFAGLGRWVTRRNVILLAIVPTLSVLLVITDEAHHLVFGRVWFDGFVRFTAGPVYPYAVAYAYLLPLLNTVIFLWLFVRSSGIYRWQVGLVVFGGLVPRTGVIPELLGLNPLAPLDMTILTADMMALCYAIALFRFHMFDVMPVARSMLLGLMREGMLVLDAQDRVVELNQAAVRLLSIRGTACIGKPAAEVLAAFPDLAAVLGRPGPVHVEVAAGAGAAPVCYEVIISPLVHERGWQLGRLVLLYDITERKRARVQRMEQQRATATIAERDRLARELHDNLGQVLGYVKMQAQAARRALEQDHRAQVDANLSRIASAAQDAHDDVREFLLGVQGDRLRAQGFRASLVEVAQRYSRTYDMTIEVRWPEDLREEDIGPEVQVQLLRIIQESLSNVRRHAGTRSATLSLAVDQAALSIVVHDDGRGFDPALAAADQDEIAGHYGLRFMRERAEEIGGSVEVTSAPGQSTDVVIRVPTR